MLNPDVLKKRGLTVAPTYIRTVVYAIFRRLSEREDCVTRLKNVTKRYSRFFVGSNLMYDLLRYISFSRSLSFFDILLMRTR